MQARDVLPRELSAHVLQAVVDWRKIFLALVESPVNTERMKLRTLGVSGQVIFADHVVP